MAETESPSIDSEFRQGDIIQIFQTSQQGDVVPRLGVVINADCDLVHCKIDGAISYLPTFDFRTYFGNFWLPAYFQERLTDLTDSICKSCDVPSESSSTLMNWLDSESIETVLPKICSEFRVKQQSIKPKLQELELIRRAKLHDVALLKSIWLEFGVDTATSMKKLGLRALKNIGDGGFFLNEIVGLDPIGFVVRFKRIHSVSASSVFRTFADLQANTNGDGPAAYRVSRLTELYRFKIAQLFCAQFSRIGLPDEITNLNDFAVEAAIATLE